jgi:hypothetical protein
MIRASFGFGENVDWGSLLRIWPATLERQPRTSSSRWITRSDAKVDRVACPWLIRRFIDPRAEFFFVPEEQLLQTARKLRAIPFDANRFPEIKLNHRGERCTFEAILEDYAITDPALHRLALVVRGADIKGQEQIASESLGLRAIAHGFAQTGISDEERLNQQFPIYDALYQFLRSKDSANFRIKSARQRI